MPAVPTVKSRSTIRVSSASKALPLPIAPVPSVSRSAAIVTSPVPKKLKALLSVALPNSIRSEVPVSLRMLFGPSSPRVKSEASPYWIIPAPLKSTVAAPKLRAVTEAAETVVPVVMVRLSSIVTVPSVESMVRAPLEVSISLSPVTPIWMLPKVAPVEDVSPVKLTVPSAAIVSWSVRAPLPSLV